MQIQLTKIALIMSFGLAICFAQEAPENPPAADTTIVPLVADTTITPSVADTTVAPPVADTTIAPSVADTTITPLMADTTITPPTADTTIAPPTADTAIVLPALIIPQVEFVVPQSSLAEILAPVVEKKLATNECVVDVPPSSAPVMNVVECNSGKGNGNRAVSFGVRTGINLSHTYAEYNLSDDIGSGDYGDIFRMQLGFVLDIAINDRFHIQPGFMYIQKGMSDVREITAHYLEFPLLLSLKFSAFRLGVGPYIGLCLNSYSGIFDDGGFDIGLSTGLGFDIGMFYIGAFYDYGFADVSNKHNYNFYNRTLGFNLGVNL